MFLSSMFLLINLGFPVSMLAVVKHILGSYFSPSVAFAGILPGHYESHWEGSSLKCTQILQQSVLRGQRLFVHLLLHIFVQSFQPSAHVNRWILLTFALFCLLNSHYHCLVLFILQWTRTVIYIKKIVIKFSLLLSEDLHRKW